MAIVRLILMLFLAQMMKLGSFYQNKFSPRFSFESRQAESKHSSGFKYIDVNYVPQHRVIAGVGGSYMTRDFSDLVPRSLANLRLPRRNGLHSHGKECLKFAVNFTLWPVCQEVPLVDAMPC